MRHPYRTVSLIVAAVLLLTGCSTAHHFTLLLTVENADTGAPVEDVIAVLDTNGNEERKLEHDYATNFTFPWTDKQGRLAHDFMISPYPDDRNPAWYLKLRKRGFEPVVVDIKPAEQPRSNEATPLPVTVRMKAIPEKP